MPSKSLTLEALLNAEHPGEMASWDLFIGEYHEAIIEWYHPDFAKELGMNLCPGYHLRMWNDDRTISQEMGVLDSFEAAYGKALTVLNDRGSRQENKDA